MNAKRLIGKLAGMGHKVVKAAMVKIRCKNCGRPKMVRVADRKRGWGLFCNKKCKAQEQERRTGQYARFQQRQSEADDFVEDDHPFSSEALGQS